MKAYAYYLAGDARLPERDRALLKHIKDSLQGLGIDCRVVPEERAGIPIYKLCVDELWHIDIVQMIAETPAFDITSSGYVLKPHRPQSEPPVRQTQLHKSTTLH